MLNRLCYISRCLHDKYRLLYSKKEIKICLVIDIFIYYMLDHAQEYDLNFSRLVKKEIIPALAGADGMWDIQQDIIVFIEKQLNLNSYISNVYGNLRMFRNSKFMEEAFEMTLNCVDEGPIKVNELIDFLKVDLEINEIKEGKTLNQLIKAISDVRNEQRILDNFAGFGETVLETLDGLKSYIQLQDASETQCAIATILCVIKGCQNFKVLNVDTLEYNPEEIFDLIVSVPPLILDTTEYYNYNTQTPNFGMKRGNWGSVAFSLGKLELYGRLVTVVNAGALTSENKADRWMREYLCEKGYLQAIIELPEKMLYGTSAKVAVVVIQKVYNEKIKMINLDDKLQSSLTREPTEKTGEIIQNISEILREEKVLDIARVVEKDDLFDGYQLLPSLYIDSEQEYEYKSLWELRSQRKKLLDNLFELEENYDEILQRLRREKDG